MVDPAAVTLAGGYATVSVTITSTAQSVAQLISASLPTGLGKTRILQFSILGTQSASASDRAAVLFGNATEQLGYLVAGDERVFPVRGDVVYVKRAGGSDVPAVIEVYLREPR